MNPAANHCPLLDDAGQIGGNVILTDDVSERKRSSEALLASEKARREDDERLKSALESCHIGACDLNLQEHTAYRSQRHKRVACVDQKQAEEALAESELRYRTLADSGQALIWTSGTDKKCDYFNKPWLGFTGRTLEQEVGDGWLEGVHPADFDRCLHIYVTAFDKHEPFSMDYRLRHCSGDYRWIQDDGTPRFSRNGNFMGYIGHCLDISWRKHAEEEAKTLLAQLHQARKMEAIGVLAGGIAHDFNNILSAITGYAEMISADIAPGTTTSKYLDQVLLASQRAASLVQQILAFSRQGNMQRIPLTPGHLVKEAIKFLRPSLPATITFEQEIKNPTRSIIADPTQFHQILMNLGTNAFQAMEQTGGTLTIILKDCELSSDDLQHEPEIRPGTFVMLSIGDTGTGIRPEIQGKIFDPYFTTKGFGKGTGMGLALVHGIVVDSGGFITCESAIGKGTVFSVFFPAIDQKIFSAVEPVEDILSGTERVLFVDDEEMLADLGKAMLEQLGYQVTARTSSLEALALLQNQPGRFDAVITDQTMPDMTGIDLARRMLQIRADLPIILCTGHSTLISEEQAKAEGVKGFIMKPFVRTKLAQLLRAVLDQD